MLLRDKVNGDIAAAMKSKETTRLSALRMLKAGWLAAEWGLSPRNRKVRIYKITAAGRKQLEREVSSFQQMLDGIARAMKAVRP